MKALISLTPGGPESLIHAELPAPPPPGPGRLNVRVLACGINFPDVLMIEDKYQNRPTRPYAPGCEIAGRVEAVGEGVDGFAVGDRVVGTLWHGGLAERASLPALRAAPMPAGMTDEEGAGFVMTYATVWHALVNRAALKAGETLLVLGAGGGVGLAAVELGHALGARVIAAASSADKLAAARAAGAAETVLYPAGGLDTEAARAFGAALKDLAKPDGVRVALDPVGGAYAEPAIRALGWRGRFLVVGFTAGIPKLPLNLALLKELDVLGVAWGAHAEREPMSDNTDLRALLALYEAGKIKPRIGTVLPFARGIEAIRLLADRQAVGKVVVRIGTD